MHATSVVARITWLGTATGPVLVRDTAQHTVKANVVDAASNGAVIYTVPYMAPTVMRGQVASQYQLILPS